MLRQIINEDVNKVITTFKAELAARIDLIDNLFSKIETTTADTTTNLFKLSDQQS
jgi:sensor domain CHASE-containing protein